MKGSSSSSRGGGAVALRFMSVAMLRLPDKVGGGTTPWINAARPSSDGVEAPTGPPQAARNTAVPRKSRVRCISSRDEDAQAMCHCAARVVAVLPVVMTPQKGPLPRPARSGLSGETRAKIGKGHEGRSRSETTGDPRVGGSVRQRERSASRRRSICSDSPLTNVRGSPWRGTTFVRYALFSIRRMRERPSTRLQRAYASP